MLHWKRVFSLLLVVALCLTMLPSAALAAKEPEGLENFTRRASYDDSLFTDVTPEDWFFENVKSVYELGLMIGKGRNRFDPAGSVTVAEAVAIAARLHAIYHTGEEAFAASDPWYQSYVDYARVNGIDTGSGADLGAAATRAQFAVILAGALPEEALAARNQVDDGAIPDVSVSDPYGEAVYRLYRAGVMNGNDSQGTFAPNSTIKRSEAAAIVTRMADTDLRMEAALHAAQNQPSVSGTHPGFLPDGTRTCTVTFLPNGDNVENMPVPQTVQAGGHAAEPEAPTREGYAFGGWYLDAQNIKYFNFEESITEDIVLYAQWIFIYSEDDTENYSIIDLKFDPMGAALQATVFAVEDCFLRWYLVSDETGDILQSGETPVPAATEEALDIWADISTELPEYFKIVTVLVDESGQPLSNQFEYLKYTKAYADFLGRTIFDYPSEKVVNLDEAADINFMVANSETAVIFYPKADITYDEALRCYVFSGDISQIKYCNPGSKIVVYNDEEVYFICVEEIAVNDDAAVIVCAEDTMLADFVDMIKIDTYAENSAEEAPEEELQFGDRALPKAADNCELLGDIGIGEEHGVKDRINLDKEGEYYIDLQIKSSLNFKLFFEKNKKYKDGFLLETTFVTTIEASVTLVSTVASTDNKDKKEEFHPSIPITIPTSIPGLKVNCSLEFPVEWSAGCSFKIPVKCVASVGYLSSNQTGVQKVSNKNLTYSEMNLTIEFKVKSGVKLNIGLSWTVLEANMGFWLGVELDIKIVKEFSKSPDDPKWHMCDSCASIELYPFFEYSIGASININEKLQGKLFPDITLLRLTWTTIQCYVSFGGPEDSLFGGEVHFDEGKCPNNKCKVSISVYKASTNENDLPIRVYNDAKKLVYDGASGTTLRLYEGTYYIEAIYGGETYTVGTYMIKDATEISFNLSAETAYLKLFIVDSATQTYLEDCLIEFLSEKMEPVMAFNSGDPSIHQKGNTFCQIPLLYGKYNIRISCEGYVTSSGAKEYTTQVKLDQDTTVSVKLVHALLSGHVVTEDLNSAVRDASVQAADSDGNLYGPYYTDDRGYFSIPIPGNGTYSLSISAENHYPKNLDNIIVTKGAKDLGEIELSYVYHQATIYGTLCDSQGNPANGASVLILNQEGNTENYISALQDDTFRIPVETGVYHDVLFYRQGIDCYSTSVIVDRTTDLGTITLSSTPYLWGKIVDGDTGKDIYDVKISFYKNGAYTGFITSSGIDGRIGQFWNQTGVFEMVFEKDGYGAVTLEQVALVNGLNDLGTIQMSARLDPFQIKHGSELIALGGQEQLCNGEGDANWTVVSDADWTMTVTGDASWFTVSPMSGQKGETAVKVSVTGSTDQAAGRQATLHFTSGGKTYAVTVFQKAYPVSGTVTGGGQAISGASVTVFSNVGFSRTVSTDAGGSFSVPVPDGWYSVTVAADGFDEKTVNVPTPVSMESGEVKVSIELQDESNVKGVILDASTGQPLEGVSVQWSSYWSNVSTVPVVATTNAAGAFRFQASNSGLLNAPETAVRFRLDGYVDYCTMLTVEDGVMTDLGTIEMVPADPDAVPVQIAMGKCGDNLYWDITRANKNSSYATLTVSGTGEMWGNCSMMWRAYNDAEGTYDWELTEIDLKEGVTSLGSNALSNLFFVNEITLPASLISLDEYAFSGNRLYYISVLEDNLSYTSVDGILYNKDMTELVMCPCLLEYRMTEPNPSPYSSSILRMTVNVLNVPETVRKIGDHAFEGNWTLQTVILPDSVTEIGELAFSSSSLISIELPDSITTIGHNAFNGCRDLVWIKLPNTITDLWFNFMYCESLETIVIPETVTSWSSRMFYGCSSLKDIYFMGPADAYVDSGAFEGCASNLTLHYVDGQRGWTTPTWTTWDGVALKAEPFDPEILEDMVLFSGTCGANITWELRSNGVLSLRGSGAMNNYYGSTYEEKYRAPWICARTLIRSVEIQDGITSLGNYAFEDCVCLETISLPDSVESFGKYAFSDCDSLVDVILPSGLTQLSDYAFSYCDRLTSVSMNCPGLLEIGNGVFNYCYRLCDLVFPENLETVGNAFRVCWALEELTFPASLEKINSYAFRDCTSLKRVYFLGDAPELGTTAFPLPEYFDYTLYYIEGKSGWTSPTWTASNGTTYNTATFRP